MWIVSLFSYIWSTWASTDSATVYLNVDSFNSILVFSTFIVTSADFAYPELPFGVIVILGPSSDTLYIPLTFLSSQFPARSHTLVIKYHDPFSPVLLTMVLFFIAIFGVASWFLEKIYFKVFSLIPEPLSLADTVAVTVLLLYDVSMLPVGGVVSTAKYVLYPPLPYVVSTTVVG